jgi:AcrR family transcriptional regulator
MNEIIQALKTDMATKKPPRRSHAERVAESDRRLLQAGMELVAENGYTQTTVGAIGERAGYSRGQVSQRFGSKDGLLRALVAKLAADSRQRMRLRMASATGLDAIDLAIDAYLEGMNQPTLEARAYFVLMLESIGPAPQVRPAFAEAHVRHRAAFVSAIEAGQQRHEINPNVDATIEATLLVALLRGIRLNWMLDPVGLDIKIAIKGIKHNMRATLAVRP